ncbi:MAG: type II toxin-antitoxin system RelE family toxin [Rhabdochlamydiaceae bacterium]
MTYAVNFTNSARKELNKLPKQTSLDIAKAIYRLSGNPRGGNVRPMVGTKSWRLRIGNYRVIYDISDKELKILIIRGRQRKDVYRGYKSVQD